MTLRSPSAPALSTPAASPTAGGFEDHAPVYRQIGLILRERIGPVWRPGDELPSEGQLATEFGVNRNTLRRAIGVLVDEGIVERRRGVKLRVARLPSLEKPKLEADPTQLFRMRPGTEFKVLGFSLQPLPADAAPLLDLPALTEAYRIDRLLMAGDEVLAFLVVYVPVDIGKRLKRLNLTKETITSILHGRLGVRTRRIRQTIEAGLADATVAAALGMAPGAATLRCRYVVTDVDDRPVQAATYYYPGDRFRLTLEIQTRADGEDSGARRLDHWPLSLTSTQGEAAGPPAPARRRK
jgi:DNA-binding GntR family transcriptional regulator